VAFSDEYFLCSRLQSRCQTKQWPTSESGASLADCKILPKNVLMLIHCKWSKESSSS
jgi:hypothetical protein